MDHAVSRPSAKDHATFAEVLRTFEKRSTCARVQVAALIVKDGRIISTGWNGVAKGRTHCNEKFRGIDMELGHEGHRLFSDRYELHAEQNAIGYAAKETVATNEAVMYCSCSPCLNCAKLIVASGITCVYFLDVYDRAPEGIEFLLECGVGSVHLDGY